jgi:hypothetical protein
VICEVAYKTTQPNSNGVLPHSIHHDICPILCERCEPQRKAAKREIRHRMSTIGGLMVIEECSDVQIHSGQVSFHGFRCLLCGEIVDPRDLGKSTPIAGFLS